VYERAERGPGGQIGEGRPEVGGGIRRDRLVEHLVAILDRSGVGTREKNELLGLLAPLKRDVVTK